MPGDRGHLRAVRLLPFAAAAMRVRAGRRIRGSRRVKGLAYQQEAAALWISAIGAQLAATRAATSAIDSEVTNKWPRMSGAKHPASTGGIGRPSSWPPPGGAGSRKCRWRLAAMTASSWDAIVKAWEVIRPRRK